MKSYQLHNGLCLENPWRVHERALPMPKSVHLSKEEVVHAFKQILRSFSDPQIVKWLWSREALETKRAPVFPMLSFSIYSLHFAALTEFLILDIT
jgi:hypothetical protein